MFGPDDESFMERTHPTGRPLELTMLREEDNRVKRHSCTFTPHVSHGFIHEPRNPRTISIRRNKI